MDDGLKESYSSEGEVAGVLIAQGSSALDLEAGSERRIICINAVFLVALWPSLFPFVSFWQQDYSFRYCCFVFK